MMARWSLVLPVVALLAPAEAWALKPAKHRQLAEASCAQARLPDAFCRRMGKAVYETDYREWEDLSAHAQTARGQDRCSAAEAATTRVESLARSVVTAVRARDYERAAVDLGRALHTIQDECAHHGMTNEEHAFLSLEQTCEGMDTSPDVQPEAIACAAQRTATVMNQVRVAVAGTAWSGVDGLCRDWHGDNQDSDACANASLPSPVMACEFLSLFDDYNGVDSRWNSAVVGPSLLDAFEAGLRGDAASRTMCAGDAHAIDPVAPHAVQEVRDVTCGLTDIGCLGKVDDGTEVDPYGEDTAPATGGCSSSGGAGSLLLALLSVSLLGARSRARSGSSRDRASSSPCT